MRGSMWLLTLGCGLMLSASGCCGGYMHGGCGGCGCDTCCDSGPIYGRRPVAQRGCGDDCGTCQDNCDSCCDTCDGCCQRNFCFHPLRWLGNALFVNTWCGPRCGSGYCGGCGESSGCCGGCDGGNGGQVSGSYQPAVTKAVMRPALADARTATEAMRPTATKCPPLPTAK